MNMNDFFADLLQRNLEMLKMILADFSDNDMVSRPCPGANHAAWQLGHLIVSETHLVNNAKPNSMPELPAGFADKFTKETSKLDDPKAFAKKDDMLALMEKVRAASIRWAKSMTPQDMAVATTGPIADFAPTAQHIAALLPDHVAMHIGQFQVIRRKLGKPILF